MNILLNDLKMKTLHVIFSLLTSAATLAFTSTAESFSLNGKPVPDIVATVNGSELSAALLERELTAYKLLASQQGRRVRSDQEEKIAQGVLMRAIDQELLRQKGVALDIKIEDNRIDAEIENIRSKFPNEESFLHALRFQHLSLESLRDKISRQLTSEEFVRREIAPNVKLEEGQAKKFYNENAAAFVDPARYETSHIFTPTLPAVQKDKYDSREAAEKAERMVEQINQSALESMEETYKRLQAGADFSKLVQEVSEDPESQKKDGSIGSLILNQVQPSIAEAVSALKVGEFSKPVQTSAGLHIFKLTGKTPSKPIPFEQVESEILNHLLKLETKKQTDKLLGIWRKKADIKIFI